jgi:hypothetical protein
MATFPTAADLDALGLGPARSRTLVTRFPHLSIALVTFAATCREAGTRFKVFQASGRDGYHAQLRLMVITGKAPNGHTDSRGYEGPFYQCEVGSMSTTKAQTCELGKALAWLAAAADVPFGPHQGEPANAALRA